MAHRALHGHQPHTSHDQNLSILHAEEYSGCDSDLVPPKIEDQQDRTEVVLEYMQRILVVGRGIVESGCHQKHVHY